MIEREPSFEDERIRTWTYSAERGEPETFEEDPTVMHLDVEREEIFESRIYRFRPDPEVLLYLIDQTTVSLSEQSPSPEEIVQFAKELMEDTTFKLLAKRNKPDGLVSSLLVAAGGGERFLLLPGTLHKYRTLPT